MSSVPAGPARLTHKHRSRRGSKAVTERREPPVLRPPAEMSEAPAAGGVGHDLRPGGTCAQHRDPAREQPRICRRVLGLPQRTTANGGLKRETYSLPALEVGSPTLTPALKAQGRLCPGPASQLRWGWQSLAFLVGLQPASAAVFLWPLPVSLRSSSSVSCKDTHHCI